MNVKYGIYCFVFVVALLAPFIVLAVFSDVLLHDSALQKLLIVGIFACWWSSAALTALILYEMRKQTKSKK